MGFILPAIVVILMGITGPAIVDATIGDSTLPNDALYGVERFGESVRSAAGVLSADAIVRERVAEASVLANQGLPEKAMETLDAADREITGVPTSARPELRQKIEDTRKLISEGRFG